MRIVEPHFFLSNVVIHTVKPLDQAHSQGGSGGSIEPPFRNKIFKVRACVICVRAYVNIVRSIEK